MYYKILSVVWGLNIFGLGERYLETVLQSSSHEYLNARFLILLSQCIAEGGLDRQVLSVSSARGI